MTTHRITASVVDKPSVIRQYVKDEKLRVLMFGCYRYRFLFVYVVIGVLSLGCEVFLYRGLEHLGLPYISCAMIGVAAGILVAYWGNVRFNFKVPSGKRRRALLYFVAISICSWSVQFLFRREIQNLHWSYERARFVISGSAFFLAYLLHKRFSFSDYKKVGVAVYANGIEDIKSIYDRIEKFADIIHVDLVDASYGREDYPVLTYRLEVVRAYWPDTPVHVHVMSRTPLRYLRELYPYVDRVYVHVDIDEELDSVLADICKARKQAGLALTLATPIESVRQYLDRIAVILFLAIPEPGTSGQVFQLATLDRIADFNLWPERARIDVCVDGGVTERNVGLLNVEIVVSGSSVLKHENPQRQIMRLQTSSNYEHT